MAAVVLLASVAAAGSVAYDAGGAVAQTELIDFTNAASRMDVGQWNRTFGSYWTDYDVDGDVDFLLNRHQYYAWFFEKRPGRFDRVSEDDLNKFFDRHGCAWGQATVDRRPDLYCTQGADTGSGRGPNQLLIGTRDGFRDRTRAFSVGYPKARGRSANWIDYDGDNDLDLFVANIWREEAPNAMFRNLSGKGFKRVGAGVAHHMGSVHSAWADWDRDGDPDIAVFQEKAEPAAYENLGGRFDRTPLLTPFGRDWSAGAFGDYDGDGWVDLHLVGAAGSLVLHNRFGTFVPVHEFELTAGRSSQWFDVENDGDLDLFIVQGATPRGTSDSKINRPDLLLVNDGTRFVVFKGSSVRGPKAGNGDSVAIADFNRDGSQDAFVTNGYGQTSGPNTLLKNRSAGGNWVGLDLRGMRKNPMGFGSEIRVTAGLLSYSRYVNDGVGARTQSEAGYVHLGLRRASRAAVEVRWPDGRRDCLSVRANRVVRVARGSSPCT